MRLRERLARYVGASTLALFSDAQLIAMHERTHGKRRRIERTAQYILARVSIKP